MYKKQGKRGSGDGGKKREQWVDAIILLGGHVDQLVSDMRYAEAVNNVMAKTPVVITGKLDGTR